MTIRFTSDEVRMMAAELLKSGLSPRTVRLQLAQRGIHWEYQFINQGLHERQQRLRRQGQTLCRCGEHGMAIGASLCDACLAAKWSPASPPPIPS
jgi:hypothetical protein